MKKKNVKKMIVVMLFSILPFAVKAQITAQKIGKNPTTKNPGTVLELESDDKGILFPRIALSNTNTWGLAGTATKGMVVYNTRTTADASPFTGTEAYPVATGDGTGLYFWDGNGWAAVTKPSDGDQSNDAWVNDSTNTTIRLGTQSNGTTARTVGTDVVVKDNGYMGIGTKTPQNKLHVNGAAQVTGELNIGGSATTAGSVGTAGQLLTSGGTGSAPMWTNGTSISGVSRIVVNNEGAAVQSISGSPSSGNVEIDLVAQKFNNNTNAFSFNAADNSVTIKQAGLYEVKAFISFSSFDNLEGDIVCSLSKNGTIYKRIIISRTANNIHYSEGYGVGGSIVSTDSYAVSDKIEILVNRVGSTVVSTFSGSVNISFEKIN